MIELKTLEIANSGKLHPHQGFIDEVIEHLEMDRKNKGYYDRHTKAQLHNLTAKYPSHERNEEKAHGLHKIAERHGFIQDKNKKHMYHHPESGAKLNIHHPHKTMYTDKYVGAWLSTPKASFK